MADRESFVDLLGARCEPFVHLSRGQLEALWEHFDLIRRWNRLLNLTRVESVAEAVDRHYAESLFLASLLPPTVGSVVDIGSGAGFPGIPLAIARPDCRLTLVESHKRKAAFLREATGAMANVAVEAERIEALPGKFDVAVSRAVQLVGILPWVSIHAAAFAVLTTPELASALRTSTARVDLIPIPWHPAHVAAVGLFHVEPAE